MAVEILRFFENSAIISTVNNFNHYNKIRRVNFRGQIFQMLFYKKPIQAYSSTYLGSMSTKDPYLPKISLCAHERVFKKNCTCQEWKHEDLSWIS